MRDLTLTIPPTLIRPRWRRVAALAAIMAALGVVIGILTIASASPLDNTALAQATTHQPEKITELSFNAAGYLPKAIDAGETYTVTYNITNHQGRRVEYTAVVTLIENGHPRSIANQRTTLADGDSQNIPVKFSTPEPGTDLELIVSLPAQNQEIHFRSKS